MGRFNNTISEAEAYKKVQEIIKRIENSKTELRRELNKTKAEIEARRIGATKAGSFDLDEILNNDNSEILSKLKSKVKKLEAALNMPYYADAEFRKYSLIYLKAKAEDEAAKMKVFNDEVAELNRLIETTKQKLWQKQNDEFKDIKGIFYSAALNIGVNCFHDIAVFGSISLFEQYEELCNKYE